MPKRNFDSGFLVQRTQNKVYARNLYNRQVNGQSLINNPLTTNGGASQYNHYKEGAETMYFKGIYEISKTVDIGGIVAIPPYPPSSTVVSVPSPPTILLVTPSNGQISISFTAGSNGGRVITNYLYSLNSGEYIALNPADPVSPINITGLTNGTTYNITLKALNVIGVSAASDIIVATPATVPDPPIDLAVIPDDMQALISFTAGFNGGSDITNYLYSLNGGVFTALSPANAISPVTISGLVNGTPYSITLKAINMMGASITSSAVSVIPIAIPDPPTGLSATPGNQQATISFTAGYNGGNAITNYLYSLNGGAFTALSPADATSPITISGLANSTLYSITLKAINDIGTSLESDAVIVTPATVPDPPTGLTATPGNQQATIRFTAGSNGGSVITNYLYSLNGGAFIALNPADPVSPITITGLTNGTTYNIQLKALNTIGTSIASSTITTKPDVPINVPGAPTNLSAVPGNGQVTISFTPGSSGGSTIDNYIYSKDGGATYYTVSSINSVSSITITKLIPGSSYNIKLIAHNRAGYSTPSDIIYVTLPIISTYSIATQPTTEALINSIFRTGDTLVNDASNSILLYSLLPENSSILDVSLWVNLEDTWIFIRKFSATTNTTVVYTMNDINVWLNSMPQLLSPDASWALASFSSF